MLVAGMGLPSSASAILLDRGPDMVYDTVLDITWTRNASLPGSSGLTWDQANAFAANLVFGGFDDWRLPYASVAAGAGPITTLSFLPCTGAGGADEGACRDNEMAYMFYYNLGGTWFPATDKTGNQTALGGEMLTGIQPDHWSATQYDADIAWYFSFTNGSSVPIFKDFERTAWAVRSGDVDSVDIPEPASLLLFGIGMVGLGWARRRKPYAPSLTAV